MESKDFGSKFRALVANLLDVVFRHEDTKTQSCYYIFFVPSRLSG